MDTFRCCNPFARFISENQRVGELIHQFTLHWSIDERVNPVHEPLTGSKFLLKPLQSNTLFTLVSLTCYLKNECCYRHDRVVQPGHPTSSLAHFGNQKLWLSIVTKSGVASNSSQAVVRSGSTFESDVERSRLKNNKNGDLGLPLLPSIGYF